MLRSSSLDPEAEELAKTMAQTIDERLFEVNKLYQMGLTEFINAKKEELNMSKALQDKLEAMLMRHHEARIDQIFAEKRKPQTQLFAIEDLILKYRVSCFQRFNKTESQYERDLIQIKYKMSREKVREMRRAASGAED